MNNRFFVIIGVLILTGCNMSKSPKESIIKEFPIVKKINVTTIKVAPVILTPEEIFIIDDKLWVFQRRADSIFSAFSLPECRYLSSTGMLGEGPDEFVQPMSKTIQTKGREFTIFDGFVLKTATFSTDGSIRIKSREKIFETLPVNGFNKLNKQLYCAFADCAMGTEGDNEYRMLNTKSGEQQKFSNYPDLTEKKYEGDKRCQIYYKFIASDSTKKRFVACYSLFKYIRIYSYKGELIKEIHVDVEPHLSHDIEDWEKREYFYGRPFTTENYFYAPCSANEIQVWDWDGNPVAQYKLDIEFFAFAVSEKYKKVYLVSAAEKDLGKIYCFDL